MTNANVDRGLSSPEVYTERPILFKVGNNGSVLFGMVEYSAGMGQAPSEGDQLVLSIMSGAGKTLGKDEGGEPILVDLPPVVLLEGVFNVTEVVDGAIDSPFFIPQEQNAHSIWGLTLDRVRDIESEEEIEIIEKAGVISII